MHAHGMADYSRYKKQQQRRQMRIPSIFNLLARKIRRAIERKALRRVKFILLSLHKIYANVVTRLRFP